MNEDDAGPRNVVVCSDGTGNTFDRRASNVTALMGHLVLDPQHQMVIYDQGIGTTADRVGAVRGLALPPDRSAALEVLDAPTATGIGGWVAKLRGQAAGYGLKENVGQLYQAVAEHCRPQDRLFLFGFSRGAFTVRALAGLMYRCGLPDSRADAAGRFEQAWELFQPMQPSTREDARIEQLRSRNRDCTVHFLGLWDTVKSYGGLRPVILPHLRHNPTVSTVRHALALDERRAWFKPTTWGRLDSDRDSAMTRLSADDRELVEQQDILEVWFSGCHSDIGGGGIEHAGTARIALRWMLAEAAAPDVGLLLEASGAALLREQDPAGPPTVHPSWTGRWRALEQVSREEIDNSEVWPIKRRHRGSDGIRDPFRSRRDGVVHVHATVGARHSIPGPVRTWPTKPPPPPAG